MCLLSLCACSSILFLNPLNHEDSVGAKASFRENETKASMNR